MIDGLADFKSKVHAALFARLGQRLFDTTDESQLHSIVVGEITALMAADERPLSRAERQALVRDIARDVMGLGPLEPLLADPTVSEIMVNGHDEIYIERAGRLEETNAKFESADALLSAVHNVAQYVGREIDELRPVLDARLPNGSRVHAVIPPSARRGTYLTIRKFSKN